MRLLFGIIPIALFLTLAASQCVRSGVQPDDAGYVALRVAENVRLGAGLVFNPGEKRDLVDSPIWLGVLSLLSFSSQAPLLMQVIGMALGVGVLLAVLAGPRLPVAGACASLFLGLDGLFAARATSGGSGALAALYLIGLYVLLRSGRGRGGEPSSTEVALAVWTAAAGLVRYELVLVAVPAAFGWAATDRKRLHAWLPFACAITAASLCFAIRDHYFHEAPAFWQPWPPTRAGVQAGLHLLGQLALRRPLLLLGVVVMISGWLHGFRPGRTCGLTWGLFVLVGFALLPASGGDVVRQAAAALPLAYSLAVEAVWRGTRTRFGLVAALLLVAAQPAWTWSEAPKSSTTTYAQLGQWLRTHALQGTVVGAREVGALGYYSRLQVEDVMGRISPRVAATRRTLPSRSFASADADFDPMLAQEPDLVVVGVEEPVPSATLYVPNLDAVPEPIRGDFGVYRWAGSAVWRPPVDGAAHPYETTAALHNTRTKERATPKGSVAKPPRKVAAPKTAANVAGGGATLPAPSATEMPSPDAATPGGGAHSEDASSAMEPATPSSEADASAKDSGSSAAGAAAEDGTRRSGATPEDAAPIPENVPPSPAAGAPAMHPPVKPRAGASDSTLAPKSPAGGPGEAAPTHKKGHAPERRDGAESPPPR